MVRGRGEIKAPALVVKKIGEEAYKPQQRERDVGAGHSDHDGKKGYGHDSASDGEIAQEPCFFPAADPLCELTEKSAEFGMRLFSRCRDVHARNLTRLERRSGCNAAINLRPELCSSSACRAAN